MDGGHRCDDSTLTGRVRPVTGLFTELVKERPGMMIIDWLIEESESLLQS